MFLSSCCRGVLTLTGASRLSLLLLVVFSFPMGAGAYNYFTSTESFRVYLRDYSEKNGDYFRYNTLQHASEDKGTVIIEHQGPFTDPDYYIEVWGGVLTLGSDKYSDRMSFPNGGTIKVHWKAGTEFCLSDVAIYEPAKENPNDVLDYTSTCFYPYGVDKSGEYTVTVPAGTVIKEKRYFFFAWIETVMGLDFNLGVPEEVALKSENGEPKEKYNIYSGKSQKIATIGYFQDYYENNWFSSFSPFDFHIIDSNLPEDAITEFRYRYRSNTTSLSDGTNWSEWSEWQNTMPSATEVGKYDVEWYVYTNRCGYYGKPGADDPSSFTSYIRRNVTDYKNPQVLSLMYNTQPQDLVSPGTTSQGTYMYSVDEEGIWTDVVPQKTDAGTYTVKYYIKGDAEHFYVDKGSQASPLGTLTVTISPLDLATTAMEVSDNVFVFDGQPHRAIVTVKCGPYTISPDYYSVTYREHGNADDAAEPNKTLFGDYDITITAVDGSENYVGTQTSTTLLSIGKFDLANALASIGGQPYTGSQITPTVTSVTMNDNSLTPISPDNYEISYGPNINAGTGAGTVMLTAKAESANYKGTLVIPFDIQRRKVTVTAKPQTISYNSDGEFHSSGTAYVTLALDPSYTDGFSLATLGHALKSAVLTCTDTDKGVGSYNTIYPANAKIYDGDGSGSNDVTANYEITYAAGTLTITAKDFANSVGDLSISGIEAEYAHTGSAIEPPLLKVRDKGKLLTNGPTGDYQVSYSNNTAVGTATMTITFNSGGNYTYTGGSLQQTFDIYYAVDAYERTGDANYYRTYYNNSEDLEIRDASKFGVYKGTISTDKTKVVLTDAGTVIPKQTAVMLVGTETPIKLYKAADLTAADDFTGNILLGGGTHSAELTGSERYYIFNGDAFIWAISGAMDANKAYIDGSESGQRLMTRSLSIGFSDSQTTGLDAIEGGSEMEEVWYDLQGRRLDSKPTKAGLYIRNGRKVVVKDKQ